MWQIVQHNPWLGFGPANYYHYTLLYPILGWWVRFNSHNNYVDLVGQVGVVGLLAFGWIMAEVLRLAFRLRPRMPRGFERAYVAGAVAGLAGSLVSGLLADWIIPFTYNIGIRGFRSSLLFWFFLGGVLALKRIASTKPRPIASRSDVEAYMTGGQPEMFPLAGSSAGAMGVR
jgi:O-antigen ligase